MASFQYPGVNLPFGPERYNSGSWPPIYPIGLPQARGSSSDILPVREVAMMLLMDNLTDKPNWHEKVFDEAIVEKWRQEAMTQPEKSLFVRIMEDKWHPEDFYKPECRIISEAAFEFCIAELRNKATYFIETRLVPTLDSAGNSIVKSDNLISAHLRDELVKAFETLRADQAANVDWHPRSNDMVQNLVHPSMYPFVFGRSKFLDEEQVGTKNALEFVGKGRVVPEITRMPDYGARCVDNFRLGERRSVPPDLRSSLFQWLPANVVFRDDGTAEITSYINNLHPGKYPAVYEAIEHAIDAALPAWEQCLREDGDSGDYIVTGRSKSRFDLVNEPDCEDEEDYDQCAASMEAPEPKEFEEIDYSPKAKLGKEFKRHGLQVIVKMASIELTPEKPHFPMGSWHIEGQMNERICATALFYLDSENVTDSHLSFRMQTRQDLQDDIPTAQDQYSYLERVYGTGLGQCSVCSTSCLQNYGDVQTPQGRMLAFPNVFQHRVSSFQLKDATKPGHRRFLALWLVDPHERIVSTANVPPQQKDWWAGAEEDAGGMDVPESLMTVEEANEHRLKLMDERSRHETKAETYVTGVRYSFCEH